jgi:hypothetical protein
MKKERMRRVLFKSVPEKNPPHPEKILMKPERKEKKTDEIPPVVLHDSRGTYRMAGCT